MAVLSDAKIRSLRPKSKPYKQSDFDGLYVLVNPNGSKLWRFKYRWFGKEKLLALGKYPDIGLADARRKRDEVRSLIAKGEDPSSARKREKAKEASEQNETFAKLAAELLTKKRREGKAEATLKKTEWLHRLLNADIGAIPITQITARDVLVPLRKVENKGNHESAIRMRSAAGAVFRYAIALGVADNDPTYGLKDALIRPRPQHRAAITEPSKVGGLMRAIDDFSGQRTTQLALRLLALTALRPGELRMAEWDEIDEVGAVWTVPAHRAKMRRPHAVPLSRQAQGHVEELRKLTGSGRLVFPSVRSSQRCMSENTLNAALRRLGYGKDEMSSHGFRAMFSTLANEAGLWHADAIERALAHMETNEIRRAYARGEHWDERVELAQWWADQLEQMKNGKNKHD
ncbi:tyrosine-type recombinase/integrase [Pseudooceanicola nanhaiensis]|uniref:tyrosine-type recombinase/integrase n=1 Tax=Pseudooceanicola nanhaiensis TaxID=375761 RepID=UPI001CD1D3EB|nr:integrase arm-type DNA-binding domain-containing protein [Pseudooceanicola nanhaiensis]MCA0919237.1 integrase arm-type DNA-binding domain-containing protein [Pseudooceanicola nanhaiensis]